MAGEVLHPTDGYRIHAATEEPEAVPRSHVYNPLDRPLATRYGDRLIELPPKQSVEVAPFSQKEAKVTVEHTSAGIADTICERLARWGVVKLRGPARDGEAKYLDDQEKVAMAEAQAKKGLREWAEQIILDHHHTGEKRIAAGLDHPDTDEVAKARKWLSENPA